MTQYFSRVQWYIYAIWKLRNTDKTSSSTNVDRVTPLVAHYFFTSPASSEILKILSSFSVLFLERLSKIGVTVSFGWWCGLLVIRIWISQKRCDVGMGVSVCVKMGLFQSLGSCSSFYLLVPFYSLRIFWFCVQLFLLEGNLRSAGFWFWTMPNSCYRKWLNQMQLGAPKPGNKITEEGNLGRS